MSWRLERIGEQMRGELARLLRDEVSDPRIGLVTLTRVDVAPDLATASVFFSPLQAGEAQQGEEEDAPAAVEAVAAGLESASGFLRKRLARELSLRRTPALRFRYDASIALGSKTLSLLRELEHERETHPRDDDETADAPEERD